MAELYVQVIEKAYRSFTKLDREDFKSIHDQMDEANQNVVSARKKLTVMLRPCGKGKSVVRLFLKRLFLMVKFIELKD